ncbi:MAG: class IV adenylate cyclase [Promethearchaeota archaeon]|jgi:adenylate cyclase class 2
MFEVEIKVLIPNPVRLKEKFKENQGVYEFSLIHEDTYYNMPKGLRDFKQTDEALRLRKSIKFNKKNPRKEQEIEYYLTYKGKKLDKSTKTRKELDIRIDDFDKAKEFLNSLGFQEVLTVQKDRDLYKFEFKNYEIEALIDYLPNLKQFFLEVEVLSSTEEEIRESRNILFEFLSLFGIYKDDSIKKSYLELIFDQI